MSINLLCLHAVGLSAIVLFVSQRQGFFKKNGVDVQLVPVGGTQVPEISSANPIGHIGAPAAIMRFAKGAHLKILASLDTGRLSNCLVVGADIKTPQELRGARLGARVTGAALWIHTVLALEQLGLDSKRDGIEIVSIGDPPEIMQALEKGHIDGAVLSRAQARQLEAKGFSMLLDLAPINVFGAQDALVVTPAFLEEQPAAIEGIVAGLIEGAAFALSNAGRSAVLETIKTELLITDDAAAEEGRVQLSKSIARKPYPSTERLRNMQRIISLVEPRVNEVEVQDLIDNRFVAKLDKHGFIDAAYASFDAG